MRGSMVVEHSQKKINMSQKLMVEIELSSEKLVITKGFMFNILLHSGLYAVTVEKIDGKVYYKNVR